MRRLRDHEDGFVERKLEGAGSGDLKRTLVAFANSVPEGSEGVLFIGVSDDGDVLGVSNSDKLQKTIRDICHKQIYPKINYNCEVLRVDESSVLAVSVLPVNRRPHFAGPAYVRIGSENVEATEDQYEDLIASRVDKARRILRDKDKTWTVAGIGRHIGDYTNLEDNFQERIEARIESCDAHIVRFRNLSTSQIFSEPLDFVSISYDDRNRRPMLLATKIR